MNIKSQNRRLYGSFLLMAILYFYIAWQIPYTGDDWDWGLDIGLQHLLTADINSRYAGNFFVVCMTRSKLLKTLILGLSFFLIPLWMTAIATEGDSEPNRKLLVFLGANGLLLSMDKAIWQQTYGWVSGFANYGLSLVCVLAYLRLAVPLFADELPETSHGLRTCLGAFVLAFIMELFLENLTLAMVVLSGVLCLICRIRTKKVQGNYLCLLAGNLAGMAVMFSSRIYPALFGENSQALTGRSLSYAVSDGIGGMIRACLQNFSQELAWQIWEKNLVICCCISVLLILLLIRRGKNDRWTGIFLTIDVLSIPYFVVFTYLERGKYFLQNYGLLDFAELAANLGFFAIVAAQIVVLYRDKCWKMVKLLLLWAMAPLVIAPLAAVEIEGARFFLTSNGFLILVALHLLADALVGIGERGYQSLLALGLSVMVSFGLFYGFLYREIGSCTRQRIAIMEEATATGAQEIVLPAYPYSARDYVWWGEPGEPEREAYFREFFGLASDVEMTFALD